MQIVINMSFDDVGWSSEGALLNPLTTVSRGRRMTECYRHEDCKGL